MLHVTLWLHEVRSSINWSSQRRAQCKVSSSVCCNIKKITRREEKKLVKVCRTASLSSLLTFKRPSKKKTRYRDFTIYVCIMSESSWNNLHELKLSVRGTSSRLLVRVRSRTGKEASLRPRCIRCFEQDSAFAHPHPDVDSTSNFDIIAMRRVWR